MFANRVITFYFVAVSFLLFYNLYNIFSYPDTDVVLICYSVARNLNVNSLDSVKAKWILEIKEHLPQVPIMLGNILNKTHTNSEVVNTL